MFFFWLLHLFSDVYLSEVFSISTFSEEQYSWREYKGLGESTNGPAATLFIYNPFRRFEAWRFVTYMFVHVGVMHIMMNLIIQIFLGVALELVHHWWRVALVYLAGVAAGSMGTSIVNPRIFLAGMFRNVNFLERVISQKYNFFSTIRCIRRCICLNHSSYRYNYHGKQTLINIIV